MICWPSSGRIAITRNTGPAPCAGTASGCRPYAISRRLPFPEDDRLVSIAETALATGSASPVRPQNYFDWRDQQQVFENIGAVNGSPMLITKDEPVEALRQAQVTASLFSVLRVRPAL